MKKKKLLCNLILELLQKKAPWCLAWSEIVRALWPHFEKTDRSINRKYKTIRTFGIRKFEPIAIKATLRGEKAITFFKKALEVLENKLLQKCYDKYGNFSFGIKEHIELPGVKYDPNLGIFGMDVSVSLERPGYRIHRRSYKRKKVPNRTKLSPEEVMVFLETNFGTTCIKERIISYY